jgi:hypothetical protein
MEMGMLAIGARRDKLAVWPFESRAAQNQRTDRRVPFGGGRRAVRHDRPRTIEDVVEEELPVLRPKETPFETRKEWRNQ